MRRVIHKLFFIWQLEKEQAWINEMARHGYSLEHAGRLSFVFEETDPGKYTYKSLFLKGSSYSEANLKFFRFLEEMGIKVVCTINYPGTCWVYTRGLTSDFPDGIEIYSDIDSRINNLKVTIGYMIFVIMLTLLSGLFNLWIALAPGRAFLPVNFTCAMLCLALSVAAIIATVRFVIQLSKLKKERKIHE